MTTPSKGATMTIPNAGHRDPAANELATQTLADLELEQQGEQVRGGNPCCQGQHFTDTRH